MSIESLSEKAKPFYVTQAEIDATHPMNDGVECYAEDEAALIMVGERHGKRELVNLVRTLILQKNQYRKVIDDIVKGADKLKRIDEGPLGLMDIADGKYISRDELLKLLSKGRNL